MSLLFRLIEILHLLSSFSSSETEPVQSRVLPSFEDVGTGCKGVGVPPTEGLKSTSDSIARLAEGGITAGGAAIGPNVERKGEERRDIDEPEGASEREEVSLDVTLARARIRASRRALSLIARWTSSIIRGSKSQNLRMCV